jgi:hypothetical protein
MQRAVWVLVGIVVAAALWTWVPSALVQRQVAAVLQDRLSAEGAIRVRARTTLIGLVQGRVARLDIDASGVHLGDLTADRLTAGLRGIAFHRGSDGSLVLASVQSGAAEMAIASRDLEKYLGARGVENPSVRIDATGITATGGIRAGPVLANARLQGQFYAVDERDLYFRVSSLDVSGMDLPQSLANTLLSAAVKPVASVRSLPVPLRIDRIGSVPGWVIIHARVEVPAP